MTLMGKSQVQKPGRNAPGLAIVVFSVLDFGRHQKTIRFSRILTIVSL